MNLSLKSVPVLCYHRVSDTWGISPENFREQLDFLKKKGFASINAYQLYDYIVHGKDIPKKSIVLTFDDCHLDNWIYAVPILNEFDFGAIFFAITGFIEDASARPQSTDFNAVLPEILSSGESYIRALRDKDFSQFMNSSELRKTAQNYGHEILSHTVSHQMCFRNLVLRGVYPEKWHWGMYGIYDEVTNGSEYYESGSAYAYDGYWPVIGKSGVQFTRRGADKRYIFCLNEFKRSRKTLEEMLNRSIEFLCWPWGHFDEVSVNALKEAGYIGSFTVERFVNSYGSNPYRIARLEVGDNKTVDWLERRLVIYSNSITSTLFFKRFRKKNEK